MSAAPLVLTSGRIAGGAGAAAAVLRARAAAWDAPLTDEPGRLALHLWGCELRLLADSPGPGARIEIAAPERRLALTLQDSATEMLHAEGIAIAWDSVAAGALAPGLSLMRVVSVTRLTPGFLRVRLTAPDAARFATGSLHFRLLLPAAGRAPCWPRIAPTGRSVWPQGADALHRPVYTVAAQAGETLDFDIFRHPGSPTCDWALACAAGDEVGVMGPGGGWCPEGDPLMLFGDETALPAIARMLAIAGDRAGVTVRAWVRAAPHDLGALADDARVTRCDDLMVALEGAETPPGAFVWFAARDDEARAARALLADRGLPRNRFTAAAYWS